MAGHANSVAGPAAVGADIVYAIKVLAKEMGWNVYLGPGVEGEVTLEIDEASPEEALALLPH